MSAADIRQSAVYKEVHEHFRQWLEPGFGQPRRFGELDLHPTQDRVVASGEVLTELQGTGTSRLVEAADGTTRFLTDASSNARSPRFSPDGASLAFLSDRRASGVFQLHLLQSGLGEAVDTPEVPGTVEYLAWSPDGGRILLGVAGRGADAPGGDGSGEVAGEQEPAATWLPAVDRTEPSEDEWRRVWVHDVAAGTTTRVTRDGLNVWDATWMGSDRLAVVASDDPREDAWYGADVRIVHLDGGDQQVVLQPQWQLGPLAANPSGTRLAVVEALASDRGVIAGEVRLLDAEPGEFATVDCLGTDVADLAWLDDDRLGWSGLRGLDSVHGVADVVSGEVAESWATSEGTGSRYPEARWRGDGVFACALQSYDRPVCLALVRDGEPQEVASTRTKGTDYVGSISGCLESVTWQARDGLEIQGLLARPDGDGPFPLVVEVHGGPVWAFQNSWAMGFDLTAVLVKDGYAVLHPNPRGSTGRGHDFAAMVLGDMGGEDAHDILTGIDALVERGLADPDRIGITGGSYGGFMSSWLITRDPRFKASVPLSPVTNWYSQHLTSNIPTFDTMFLDGSPYSADGQAWSRSPVMFASQTTTPTLQTAGAHDRAAPPTQAIEFHNALVEAGVRSEVVVYPEEGHGVRHYPTRIDLVARCLAWFREHMPA